MTLQSLLRATALLEGGTALAFLLLPSLPSELLFGQAPQTPLALILGRFVGAVMLSLAIICWWVSRDARSPIAYRVVKAMLLYNAIATALLVYARINLGLSGILLWPGVIIHGILGAWCVMGLKGKKTVN